jgi:hypothetical protein
MPKQLPDPVIALPDPGVAFPDPAARHGTFNKGFSAPIRRSVAGTSARINTPQYPLALRQLFLTPNASLNPSSASFNPSSAFTRDIRSKNGIGVGIGIDTPHPIHHHQGLLGSHRLGGPPPGSGYLDFPRYVSTTPAFFPHLLTESYLGVSWHAYAALYDDLPRSRGIRFRRYDAQEQILIVVIPGRPHGRLHSTIYQEVRDGIVSMGLKDAWNNDGATRFFREQGHPGGGRGRDAGEPDSSGSPWPERDGQEAWPTLIIESGESSTLPGLRRDMEWWFSASDHQVKIVLLAKLDRHPRRIVLEKWEETAPPPPRPGPVTRAAARLARVARPSCAQEITIDWADGTPNLPTSHIVTGGDLRLEFDRLFLRPPRPTEGDILIPVPRLQLWASRVWSVV